ncbi:MAG: hypothetical protein ABI743_07780 [bacterium]
MPPPIMPPNFTGVIVTAIKKPYKSRTPQEEIKDVLTEKVEDAVSREAGQDTKRGRLAKWITTPPSKPGLHAYLREAFLWEWNLLGFGGAVGAAMLLGPVGLGALPLIVAGELVYLGGLVSIPRFRQAVDVKVFNYWKAKRGEAEGTAAPAPSLDLYLKQLQAGSRVRFDNLRHSCMDMRGIAREAQGTATSGRMTDVERILTSDLNQLLWAFLRYLLRQEALERFLETTEETAIHKQIEIADAKLKAAQEAKDERLIRALTDSLVTHQTRLANYDTMKKECEFVAVELDRIEGKIRAISETAITRQDLDFISSQVDSVVQSMQHTEKAMTDLNLLTGMSDTYSTETPEILEVTQ